jgi:hypothetical protein
VIVTVCDVIVMVPTGRSPKATLVGLNPTAGGAAMVIVWDRSLVAPLPPNALTMNEYTPGVATQPTRRVQERRQTQSRLHCNECY